MTSEIKSITIDKLVPHPGNPNRMSKANFAKLVRNIERTGRYEPLLVRPCPDKTGYFQIINGYHRCQALSQLGYKTADAVVWDVDDEQTDILLATLNRLTGSDVLEKKLALLKRLNQRMQTHELAKILPQTKRQIDRLCRLQQSLYRAAKIQPQLSNFAQPLVFFLSDEQLDVVEDALFLAQLDSKQKTKAGKRADALAQIARFFLSSSRSTKR